MVWATKPMAKAKTKTCDPIKGNGKGVFKSSI